MENIIFIEKNIHTVKERSKKIVMLICIFGAIWWLVYGEEDWLCDCGKPEESGVSPSLPSSVPRNATVNVLATAKIFTKASFNRIKKKKDTTLSKRADACGCFRNGLLLLMPAEYFWNRAFKTVLSRRQQI